MRKVVLHPRRITVHDSASRHRQKCMPLVQYQEKSKEFYSLDKKIRITILHWNNRKQPSQSNANHLLFPTFYCLKQTQ